MKSVKYSRIFNFGGLKMKKWFFLQRYFNLRISFWDDEVKYATDEEVLAIVSNPAYKGNRKEDEILIFELSNAGEKIKRDDLIKKVLEG